MQRFVACFVNYLSFLLSYIASCEILTLKVMTVIYANVKM